MEDIKKIGNELYFKKDDEENMEENVIDADIARDNDNVDAVKPITEDISNEVFPTSNILIDLLEKTTYMRVSEMKNDEKEKGFSTPMPEIVNDLNIILKDNFGLSTDATAEPVTKTAETNHTTFSPVILRIDAAEVTPNIHNLADTDGLVHAATTVATTFVFNNKSFEEMSENIKNEFDTEGDGEDDGEDDEDEDEEDDSDDYWDKKHGIVKYSRFDVLLFAILS